MASLVYKRVSTDEQSTARQNLVLDEVGEDGERRGLLQAVPEI
ncbi:hypothetical protein [Streptomyces antibioticus]